MASQEQVFRNLSQVKPAGEDSDACAQRGNLKQIVAFTHS
jgi:hypothetical protein